MEMDLHGNFLFVWKAKHGDLSLLNIAIAACSSSGRLQLENPPNLKQPATILSRIGPNLRHKVC